jgi:hypothetical protein
MGERGRSKDGGALRTAAIMVSALFHAGLLALLVRYAVEGTPVYDEPPTLQATLVPPVRSGPAHRDRVHPPSLDDRDASAPVTPTLPIQPVAPSTPGGDIAPGPSTASGEVPSGGAGVVARERQALRGLGGCDRVELTRQEREDCEARRWAGVAPVTARLNLDLSGRYAKNPEPFLSRRPSKGCRVRLTGEDDARGDDMNARAGITCVKRF